MVDFTYRGLYGYYAGSTRYPNCFSFGYYCCRGFGRAVGREKSYQAYQSLLTFWGGVIPSPIVFKGLK